MYNNPVVNHDLPTKKSECVCVYLNECVYDLAILCNHFVTLHCTQIKLDNRGKYAIAKVKKKKLHLYALLAYLPCMNRISQKVNLIKDIITHEIFFSFS